MPYGDELVRVTVTWRLVTEPSWSAEEAVTTFHLQHVHREGNTFNWHPEMLALPGQLRDKFIAHWAPIAVAHPTHAQIVQFKTAHIDSAGHTLDEGAVDVTDASLAGSGTSNLMPPEVALCVSAWSYEPGGFAANRGRKRGRFYLPYISSTTSNSHGRVDPAYGDGIAGGYAALFNDIQGMHTSETGEGLGLPDYWRFVTASKVDGEINQVEAVSVDDKYDAQRRRQHQAGAVRWVHTITHD